MRANGPKHTNATSHKVQRGTSPPASFALLTSCGSRSRHSASFHKRLFAAQEPFAQPREAPLHESAGLRDCRLRHLASKTTMVNRYTATMKKGMPTKRPSGHTYHKMMIPAVRSAT